MKNVSGVVTGVSSKAIPIKNGPRAGSTGYVHSATVDGHKINFGFTKPVEGSTWSGLVSDVPNRFGEYDVDRGTRAVKAQEVGAVSSGVGQNKGVQESTSYMQNSKGRSAFPIPKNDHATSICRQSALKAAVDCFPYYSSGAYSAQDVEQRILSMASTFAKWTTGQMEVEEAEKVINAMAASTSHVA